MVFSDTFPTSRRYSKAERTCLHLLSNPSAPYLAPGVVEGVPVLWFQPKALCEAAGNLGPANVLVRDLWPWVWRDSQGLRRHPITGERYPARVRWAAFRMNLIGTGL